MGWVMEPLTYRIERCQRPGSQLFTVMLQSTLVSWSMLPKFPGGLRGRGRRRHRRGFGFTANADQGGRREGCSPGSLAPVDINIVTARSMRTSRYGASPAGDNGVIPARRQAARAPAARGRASAWSSESLHFALSDSPLDRGYS